MKKYVVVSTNDKDDYLFFLPIVTWMWKNFGWNTIVMHTKSNSEKFKLAKRLCQSSTMFHELKPIEGIRDETLVQCSRLYASNLKCIDDDDYIMTSDIDMLPLSDYWNVSRDDIITYGQDLTGFVHFPICYICMKASLWERTMELSGDIHMDMSYDFYKYPQSRSDDSVKRWVVDQDIITDNLNKQKDIVRITRGLAPNSHYPLGRIDRGCWEKSLQQPLRIDAHLLRPGFTDDNFNKILKLIEEVFPLTNLDSIKRYREDYIKL